MKSADEVSGWSQRMKSANEVAERSQQTKSVDVTMSVDETSGRSQRTKSRDEALIVATGLWRALFVAPKALIHTLKRLIHATTLIIAHHRP